MNKPASSQAGKVVDFNSHVVQHRFLFSATLVSLIGYARVRSILSGDGNGDDFMIWRGKVFDDTCLLEVFF